MLKHGLALAALVLVFLCNPAHAEGTERTLSVTGHGEVWATPDIAYARVGVRTMAATAREALTENSATMAAIFEVLRERGIEDRDMRTASLSLNPRWRAEARQDGTRAQVLIGYEASSQLNVTCRDLAKLGELLDALAGAGANDMRGISFDVDDKDQLMNEARARAVRNGQAKAELFAR